MHVPPGGRLGSVHVSMRVNPKQPNLLPLPSIKLSHTRNSPGSDRMISTQHKRNLARFERLENHLSALDAGSSNLLKIFRASRAFFFLLRNSDSNVAGIFHNMA